IDDLMSQDYAGMQNGNPKPETQEAITQLGLEYRLMTQFTSFVVVEEMTITTGGEPRRIDVPVEMPEGVSREGVFGREDEDGNISKDIPFDKLVPLANPGMPTKVLESQLGLKPRGAALVSPDDAGNSPATPPPPPPPPMIQAQTPSNAPKQVVVSGGVLQ